MPPLHDLLLTIPPKTLHAYTLTHLRSNPPPSDNTPRPPSPDTLTKLTAFFSTLAPPPLLHCVRCHKGFHDIENEAKDKACRVPHDDDSALVSRISGGAYETLWGCCGQTASGDGSEGPPDGWCYEGTHTTDVRRARFRADSTMHDGKLTSCLILNCHGTRDQHRGSHAASPSHSVALSRKSNPSPARSHVSVLAPRVLLPRKIFKKATASENEADAEPLAGRVAKADTEKTTVGGDAKEPPKHKIRAKRKHCPPPSTPTTASLSASEAPAPSTKAKTTSPMYTSSESEGRMRVPPRTRSRAREESRGRTAPKLQRAVVSIKAKTTSPTQSHTYSSDWERPMPEPPRTRSRAQEESRGRTTPRLTRVVVSGRIAKKALTRQASTSANESEHGMKSDQEERGRDRKKRRVGQR